MGSSLEFHHDRVFKARQEHAGSTNPTKKRNKKKTVISKMLSIVKVASFFLLASQGVTCSADLKPPKHHLRRQEADRSGMGRLHTSRGRQVLPLLLGEEGQQASGEGGYGRPWRQAAHT